jgi:hypothetical protein
VEKMAKAKLSSYIKQIENKYNKAREDYNKVVADLEQIEKDYKAIDKSLFTTAGMNIETQKYLNKKKTARDEIIKIRNSFLQECDAIKKSSDAVFNRKYGYVPQDIDTNGLVILEKGNPTPQEIMQLGDSYKQQGNNTMLFMCAEKVKDIENADVKAWYAGAIQDRLSRPDHECIDGFIEVCVAGLRDDALLSNGVDKIHGDLLQEHLTAGDSIEVDVINPWE